MKKTKAIAALIISGLMLASASGCGLISKTEVAKEKAAVAVVSGDKITLEDFNKKFDASKKQYETMYGADFFTKQPSYLSELKSQTFNELIQEKIMLDKAKELGITYTDKQISAEADKQIASTIKNAGGQKKFDAQLKKYKMTEASFKSNLVDQLKVNMPLQKLYDKITGVAIVKDQDITNEYYTNQYNYTEKPNTMNVSHILLKTEAEAKTVLAKIKAGMNFADAAKKYSVDTGTKANGGLLGDIEYTSTTYDKDFLLGAIRTKTNTVSDPVKSQFGYHLIKINSRKEYPEKPLAKVKDLIKSTLMEQKKKQLFNTAYTTWEKNAKVEKHQDLIK